MGLPGDSISEIDDFLRLIWEMSFTHQKSTLLCVEIP